jgi:hypothetical protein
METVKSLRQKGYKVRVIHTRNKRFLQKMDGIAEEIEAKGGNTRIELTNPDKSITVAAESKCSNEDSFNHKIGNQIALGRAYKLLQEAEEKKS